MASSAPGSPAGNLRHHRGTPHAPARLLPLHNHGGGGPRQYGPIVEELAAVLPELVVYDRSGQPETVCYHWLPAMLLNKLQKQHRMLADQAGTIAAQQASLADLQTRLTQPGQLLAMRAGR